MIPKIIHYCWFGGNPLPESVVKCIESWKKYCPDYEIIEWNEKKYDVNKITYTKEAYRVQKYAFVSDYARLDIVYNHGGIYLDTDVELIKPLDEFLKYKCYVGCELPDRVATGLGFGAVKGNVFLKENMAIYEKRNFIINGKNDTTTCVDYTMTALEKMGYSYNEGIQSLDFVTIFPTEYFCPFDMQKQELFITENTHSIHHYEATWKSNNLIIRRAERMMLPIKIKLRRFVDNTFGKGTYTRMKNVFKIN
ncbi:glycosyltransferase family 32 protein [Desemzia sp. FAM 23989]|uniref:glycosyltransferase family 32 protein n=1 Tax=Desemzia sp. FAM 23989 TaxID=3259523 RepID=UPI00388868CE